MERSPEYIVRDLMNKAADDTGAAMLRTVALVQHPEDKAQIAAAALTRAMIYAGVGMSLAIPELSPTQAINVLLKQLLPTIERVSEKEFAVAVAALGRGI